MLRGRHVLAAACGLLGCGNGDDEPPANATLAEVSSLSASISIWQADDTAPTTAFVHISYDADAFRAANGECPTLGDYDIELPGATVRSKVRGGYDEEFDECYEPTAELAIADFGSEPITSLSIHDESHAIDMTFAPDVLVPHLPILRSPSTWKFAGAQEVVLGWSHPDDLVEGADFLDAPVYFHTGDAGGDPNYFDVVSTFSGDEIRFRIPSPPEITGKGYIVARFGYEMGDAATCTGATGCGYSLERGYAHSVEITR